MYKRKTPYQGKRNPQRKYRRTGTYKYAKGYSQTSGFYGRYNRASVKNSAISAGELKFKDTSLVVNTVTQTGTIEPATDGTFLKIPVGTGPSDRIGRQIKVKSINAYLTITKTSSALSTDTVRLLWVLDTQCNGTVPTVDTVLHSTNVNSFRNMANSKRFVILKDDEVNLTSQTWDGTNFNLTSRQRNFFKKCNLPIEYDPSLNTGAITTIRSNNIFLLCISMYGTCKVNGYVRIRYED